MVERLTPIVRDKCEPFDNRREKSFSTHDYRICPPPPPLDYRSTPRAGWKLCLTLAAFLLACIFLLFLVLASTSIMFSDRQNRNMRHFKESGHVDAFAGPV